MARASPVSSDMTRPRVGSRLFAKVWDTYGRLDLLFNYAGRARGYAVRGSGSRKWQSVGATNLTSAVLVHANTRSG